MTTRNPAGPNLDNDRRNAVADRIRSKMDELVKEVRERRKLEKDSLDSLKQESRATSIILNDLMKWTLGSDPIIEKRRLDMEERLCRVRKEIRDQRISFWRDVQNLKQQIRDIKDLYEAVRSAHASSHRSTSQSDDQEI